MQVYLLYFDMNEMKIKAEVLNLNNITDEKLNEEINEVLNSSGYDFYDYSEDIAILVDDQGFFKPGLPVFEINSEFGDYSKLAGKLLFVRNIETEFSTNIGSILDEDIIHLVEDLKIKIIGVTK